MRKIEIIFHISYSSTDVWDVVEEIGIIKGKRYFLYLLDERLVIRHKLDNFIYQFLQEEKDNLIYYDTQVNDERKIIQNFYKFKDKEKDKKFQFKKRYFTLQSILPDTYGCKNCKYLEDNYCQYKNIKMYKKSKNCKFFQQEFEIPS